jgi:hypothetical protein
MCKYGRMTGDPRRVLILFARLSNDPRRCYFADLFLDDILYKHIQRQIFLAEEAMFEAANAIARLTRADLVAAGVIPADNSMIAMVHDPAPSKARIQLFHEWWVRNGQSAELIAAMNEMLAPFNLTLTKVTADHMSYLYDHYILRPSGMPWSPPAPTLPPGLRDHYERELQTFRESLEPRRQELAKMWIKSHKRWEREIAPTQASWLGAINKQLATHGVKAYFNTKMSQLEEACWDLRYATVIDKDVIIHRNAISDRTYLSSPFRDILPCIMMPAKYLHPSSAAAHRPVNPSATSAPVALTQYGSSISQYQHQTAMAPTASAKIRMAITVPAGRRPGELIQFLSPSGTVNQVQIPANMMPGMQFLVNAEV